MCELFGVSSSVPSGPTEYFRRFLERCAFNPDGWGLAWYPDKAARLCKEPVPGNTSALAGFISSSPAVRAILFIGHARKTSSSAAAYQNTHPFQRELFGKEFVFAHNGNVSLMKTTPAGRFQPVGQTDSEHAFCYMLSRLEARSRQAGTELDFEWLASEMRDVNRFGKFSCLLSDGDALICRRDAGGKNGLSFLKAQSGTASRYVIASEPLSNEAWVDFQPGELTVFRQGSLVHSSAGRSNDR